MPQYNPGDFSPASGAKIDSQGNVKNTADSVDASGNQGVVTNNRKTNYQRIMVNQALAANGSASVVINSGLGTKAINAVFKSTANAYIALYPCDANGNTEANGANLASTATTGNIGSGFVYQEYGGAPYFGIYAFDKSAAVNTIQYVDVWWTMD